MRHTLPAWSSFVLLAPLVGGCAAQATVTPPAVNANVDVNATAGGTVAADGTVVGATAPGDSYDDTDPSALTDFHQTLDSHGTWVDDPTYGTVWVPASGEVGPTYTPYTTAGHWAYDANDDYVWVSDYDWGWAPYHYGRWVEIDGRGWSWIPGRVYRGAWVTWGADGGYGTVGWAPMPPEYVWRGGVAVTYAYAGTPHWSYVGRGDVFAANVGARIYTGPAAASAAGSVHATGGGSAGHSGGPSPQNLGISSSQVPHVTGASAGGIAKAQNFGHPSTAASLGGHPPTHTTGGTPQLPTGTATAAGHTPTMTPSNTVGPAGLHGAPTATTTTTTATTTTKTETPRANGQPGNTAVHTTATTTTTTTLPATAKIPPKKKLPTTEPTPSPKTGATGGNHPGGSGGGGGTGGGHSGQHPQ
jgi:hypothetical protein